MATTFAFPGRSLSSGLTGLRHTGLLIAASILALLVAAVVFPGLFTGRDPLASDMSNALAAPSLEHIFGTDHLGRDVLSRLIFGARVTLLVAISSVLIGDTIGFLWGVSSGYLGGRTDLISQRVLDVLMSLPALILALLLMAALGAGLSTVIIAIAVTRVPLSTRVVRSMVLSVKELAYVEAAGALGASGARVMARHVAPQCVAPFLIITTGHLGAAIFIEAALSFVGVGVPPPMPSWGNMLGGVLAEAFKPPWWMVVFPGTAITVTILAVNLFGDALRDFLDPKLT